MSKTVVGLFKNSAIAQNIKQQLVSEGFSSENIRIIDQSSGYGTSGYASSGNTGSVGTDTANDSGVMGSVSHFFKSLTGSDDADQQYYSEGLNQGGAILTATVSDDRADALASRLEGYGASDVSEKNAGSRATGTSTGAGVAAGRAANLKGATATELGANDNVAIPVVEENLVVGKWEVQRGGVRVYSHVVETPVEEQVQLREEHVRVQRNPVNRAATEADFEAFKEGTIEMTETAEEAVVGKQARVVEEVTISKDVTDRTETVRDTVRHTEVDVEQLPAEQAFKKTTSRS